MQSISFDRAVGYYDATRGFAPGSAERIRDAIITQTGATLDTRFLEIGIGTGRIALPFLQAGYHYTGVDLSRPMLQALCAKLPTNGSLPPLVEGDVTRLPFGNSCIDVVLSIHVLHLVADWQRTLREAGRVLARPNGQLLLAGEPGPDEEQNPEEQPPPLQAQHVWHSILEELGHPVRATQPGRQPRDPEVRSALEALGALVQCVDLTTYERPPLSARMVAEAFRNRIYSSDWSRPDDIHNAALDRLEHWLATACANPDTPYPLKGPFRAVVARWAAGA